MCRVRKDITISEMIIKKADELCIKLDLTRSTYIEMLIRADLKKRSIITEKNPEPIVWTGDIEDMPLRI